ncbi:hypothetical protein ACJMK2_021518 [Sinanodonta woodiana]|uniref:All trans-polyprenyl-diphosphate synthase PDSS1 n=1 Tax=Sinanodonta woodiana TaxID=1069815 RepID=A0ABD3TI18_SINWO
MAAVGRIRSRLHTQLLQIYKISEGLQINLVLKARLHNQRKLMVRLCGYLNYNEQVHKCINNAFSLAFRCCRCVSAGSVREPQMSVHQQVDPYKLVGAELANLCVEIKQEVVTSKHELGEIAEYYFDGKGKCFRPMLIMLASKALNFHKTEEERLLDSQRRVAMIAEMIHTASLIHDDVIDESCIRRGKSSVNNIWKERKAILAGNYLLSVASMALARIGNKDVVQVLSQTIEDLVRGEFMQLGSKEDENERFKHYLTKTFKKTASLMANSCKAIAVLGELDEDLIGVAYEYGRNIGLSFQLVDDILDFTSCDTLMGKPTAADLRLGLATAPVLFASQEFPELHSMIMRRFMQDGDVERARELVAKSDGVSHARMMAEQHCKEAVRLLQTLKLSDSRRALEHIAYLVLNRQK